MKIGVIGGGAMGCLWASLLAEQQNEVWLVEKDPARYEGLRRQGGVLFHPEQGGEILLPLAVAQTIAALPWKAMELVVLAVKAYQVDRVLAELLPLLPDGVPVLCLANGAGFAGEQLIAKWGKADDGRELLSKLGQVFFAVSFQGAWLKAPGEVFARGGGAVFWGSVPPVCPGYEEDLAARERLAKGLAPFPWCGYATDFARAQWQKLLVNSVINPLTALWQKTNGGLKDENLTEEQRGLKKALLAEGLEVAAAYGSSVLGLERENFLSPQKVGQMLEETIVATGENYSSMCEDVRLKRPTEIDFINGYLVGQGERLGVATPYHQEVYRRIKGLEVK